MFIIKGIKKSNTVYTTTNKKNMVQHINLMYHIKVLSVDFLACTGYHLLCYNKEYNQGSFLFYTPYFLYML